MKKSITKKIWYFITLLFLLVACKNPLQAPSDKNDKLSEGKVKLKIAVDFADVNSRAASVSVEDEIAYYKTLSYTLLISKPDSDSGEQALLDGCTYEEVIAAGPSIEPGEWIFSMFARDEERDMPVLFGYCTKTISADDSFVELQLQPSSSLQGTIKIKVLYGSNYLTKDDEENTVYPEFDFKVLKTKIVEGNLEEAAIPEFECILEGDEEADGLYSNTYVTDYFIGKWIIQAYCHEKIEASEIFYVSPNLTTVAEFRAGRPVKFVNKLEYNENYGIDLPFYTIKGFPERSLEAGDKLVLKISGYPDRDASLKVSSLLYEVSADDWNLLSLVSNNIEFKKDEYFTAKYYYIINDTKGLDNGVQFYYSGYDLPEELRINEFNIEFGTEEEFDKPVYTYYIGNRLAARIMGEKGKAYTLPVSTGLEDHRLLGWYDNPAFEGEPITEITAEENTTDKTFFAKYNLAFTDFGDSGWRSTSILLDVMNMSAPEPGQIITVKYSGKSNVTNNKCEFNTELGYTDDSNVWHRFENDNCWTYFVLKENEDVELRFDIKVPEDFDTTTKNLAISMGARSDEDIILSDWNVSVEYCDIETAFVNNGITAVSDQDGIHFTIENTDVTDWIRIDVEDLETGISYNLNDNLASGDAISFDYPYVNENQIYNFQMAYVKVFEGETNETWLSKKLWVKAAGGVGEVDPTAYNNITISLSDDDSDGIYRYLKFDGFDEVALLEMIPNIDEANLKFTIWAGEGWNWVYGTDIFFDENPIVNKIATEGKIEVVELAEQMDNLSKLNEEGKYWADFGLVLTQDAYGKIELPGKKTEKTTFVPVEDICYVKFVLSDGTEYKTVKVKAGETVEPFEFTETFEGKTFVEWIYSETEEPYSFSDEITEDVVLIAWCEPLYYTISFDTQLEMATVESMSCPHGYNPTLPTPKCDGYSFNYWYYYDADNVKIPLYEGLGPVTCDYTLYADWTELSKPVFDITFEVTSLTKMQLSAETEGNEVTITATCEDESVNLEGKTFVWKVDGTIDNSSDSSSITLTVEEAKNYMIYCYLADSETGLPELPVVEGRMTLEVKN